MSDSDEKSAVRGVFSKLETPQDSAWPTWETPRATLLMHPTFFVDESLLRKQAKLAVRAASPPVIPALTAVESLVFSYKGLEQAIEFGGGLVDRCKELARNYKLVCDILAGTLLEKCRPRDFAFFCIFVCRFNHFLRLVYLWNRILSIHHSAFLRLVYVEPLLGSFSSFSSRNASRFHDLSRHFRLTKASLDALDDSIFALIEVCSDVLRIYQH
ncbi:hypothetical protein KP509_10G044600 [Ceratopteris richardii]|uniref:Uncharacterized protein n=1 Tax=Ceratopteris richardii TaxID=49495 RepID=A0A8T2TX05_CERRI|nr:hypothetical protein KP509_10G044600 [Ceratopteris richardii]